MGIIFRPHRGSLADAMAEAKEFDNEEEMKKHIELYENQLTQGFSDKVKEMLISFIIRLLENVDVKLGDCRLKEEGKC